jgi:hypothetical protein
MKNKYVFFSLLLILLYSCGVYEESKVISKEFAFNGFQCRKKLQFFSDSVKVEYYDLNKNNSFFSIKVYQTDIEPNTMRFFNMLSNNVYAKKTDKLYDNYGTTGDFLKLRKARNLYIEAEEIVQVSCLNFDTPIIKVRLEEKPYNFYSSENENDLLLSIESMKGTDLLFYKDKKDRDLFLSVNKLNIDNREIEYLNDEEIKQVINLVEANLEI